MIFWTAVVGLGAVGSTVGIHVDEASGLTLETSLRVTAAIARAVEKETGFVARVDDPDWPNCTGTAECIQSVRTRLQASQVMLVRMLASPTLIRVVAELEGPGAKSATVDMPKDEAAWAAHLGPLVRKLFGSEFAERALRVEPSVSANAAPSRERGVSAWPFAVFGASAVALGTGIAFAKSGADARDRLDKEFLSDAALDRARTKDARFTTIGDVLILSAVALAIAGTVLMFLSSE